MNKFAFIAIALLLISTATANRCDGIAQWDTAAHYTAGQTVQIGGLIYTANKDNFCRNPCYPSTEWDVNPWTLVDTCEIDCTNAPAYDPTVEYGVHQIVKFEGYLYITLWGGNYNNQPDLNSQDWGAYKKLFSCKVCVTVDHDCASFTYSTGELDSLGRVCVDKGTEVTITAIAQTDALARVIGSDTQTLIVNDDIVITFDCEYAVYVTVLGNCVTDLANGQYTFWPSDEDSFSLSVEAPEKENYICQIDSITVDGVEVDSVFIEKVTENHTVVSVCSCKLICPHYEGCANTPLYNNAYDNIYEECQCVKQIFDCPNGEGTAIVFCVPEGAQIKCDQNIFDGHLIWQFQDICVGDIVDYVEGGENIFVGGTIVRRNNICYVAKWYTSADPELNFGLYQDYRFLGDC